MKKVFSMFASIVCFAVLAACSGQANAAPLNEVFTASPATTLFSVKDAAIVEKVTGGINVSTAVAVGNPDGSFGGYAKSTIAYSDSTGTTWNNFVAQAGANGFFKIGSANKYYSAKSAASVNCLSSTYTQFVYAFGADGAADAGCATFQAVKAVSN